MSLLRSTLSLSFAAALAALPSMPLSAAIIDVRSSATSRSGLVRLGDIAEIIDVDPVACRELEAVTLGPVPAPGRKLRITQQTIRERLLAHGMNLSEIEFAGQGVVLIETPPEPKSPAEARPSVTAPQAVAVRPFTVHPAHRKHAEQIVRKAFHRRFNSSSSQAGPLSLAVEIADQDVPTLLQADPEMLRFVEPGLVWGGPQTLTAQFPQADGATRIIRLQVWLNETPQIVTLKHAVPKGQVIQESDVQCVAATSGETGIEDPQEVIGQEAIRPLRAGVPLQRGDTTKVPLVRNNDLVTVTFRSPGLKVARLFRSSGTGAEGDVVNCVALDDPREKVQVRITGWHEAEILSSESVAEASPPASRRDGSFQAGTGYRR